MSTMNISLPDELRIHVEQKMKSGLIVQVVNTLKTLFVKILNESNLEI